MPTAGSGAATSTTGGVVPGLPGANGTCASGMQNLTLANLVTHGTLLTNAGFAGAPAGVGLWAAAAVVSLLLRRRR